jgi:pentatricopeptide repeat protein
MQAHLAMRIGKWDRTTDWSARAVELEKAYHKEMDVKPSQDHQYSHHLETLLRSLIHDGRFAEARTVKEEMTRQGYKPHDLFFRLHVAERDWTEALKVVEQFRKSDKFKASYLRAVVYLRQGDVARAAPEIEVLRGTTGRRPAGRKSSPEMQLWETQGLYLCLTGSGEAGVKLLERAVKKTKDDYSHHAWGNGAYYMESWGVGALKCGKLDVAEEAFLESLAHDSGSARAAMGLQILCERQNRHDEARRYADLARRFWSRASAQQIDAEYRYLREPAPGDPTKTSRADFVGPPAPPTPTAAR